MHLKVQVMFNMVQLGPFGDRFAPICAQRRRKMGNIAQDEASSTPKINGKHPVKTNVLTISR
jgi:hypothetical protein